MVEQNDIPKDYLVTLNDFEGKPMVSFEVFYVKDFNPDVLKQFFGYMPFDENGWGLFSGQMKALFASQKPGGVSDARRLSFENDKANIGSWDIKENTDRIYSPQK